MRRHGSNGREEMLLNRPQYNIEEQKFKYKTEVTLSIGKPDLNQKSYHFEGNL